MTKDHNEMISYPLGIYRIPDFVYRLWKRFMCPRGYHLLDEVISTDHYLACDACDLEIGIAWMKR